MATNNQKAVIHILKEKYGLTDKEYEDIMYHNFTVSSSIYLSEQQADQLIHLLNYTYSKDYKLGYDKAFDICCLNQDNISIIKRLYNNKHNRDMTSFEVQCFGLLNKDTQLEIIKQYA